MVALRTTYHEVLLMSGPNFPVETVRRSEKLRSEFLENRQEGQRRLCCVTSQRPRCLGARECGGVEGVILINCMSEGSVKHHGVSMLQNVAMTVLDQVKHRRESHEHSWTGRRLKTYS